jgi:type IV fimbrial biogenesis protein FimT
MITRESGGSLLELMVVIFIVAILASITMPALQYQIASREIETLARRFIAHTHFARHQALHLGQAISITPRLQNDWNTGWEVKSVCSKKPCSDKIWVKHESIAPVFIKNSGNQFSGPNSNQRAILFNAAGAAKTQQGGFVANRLILGHLKDPDRVRHLILGSGGRWRICDPDRDAKSCR